MTELKQTISSGLTARYKELAGGVHEPAAPLRDEQFWTNPFGFGNSFGHFVFHLTGNLNYYIGGQISGTGYLRDRPLAFAGAPRPSQGEGFKKIYQAI